MNAGQRSARRIVSASLQPSESICSSCLLRLSIPSRRTAATATASASPPQSSQQHETASASPPVTRQAYQIRTGVVLSRAPLLTRSLHPFEKAFFLYQRRLNERLALPFTRYFYYKKGTPGDLEWKRKAKGRLTPARDIGIYNAYSKEGWNDELLVGDKISEPESQVEALIRDAEGGGPGVDGVEGEKKEDGSEARKESSQTVAIQRPLPRRTEADEKLDQSSLNRMLDRTLYLLMKNKDGRWRFPEGTIVGKEGLHQTAERVLVQAGGIDMNTWVVGNAPIGHYSFDFPKAVKNEQKSLEDLGEKVFFMKARIMAGQADLSKNVFGDTEMKWLSKEEIEGLVTPKYWSSVRNMLVDR